MTTTSETPANDTDRREALRQRIDEGELRQQARRVADQARDTAGGFIDYAKEHPLRIVAGAIAVGLAVGAMTKPGRRVGKRGGALAALAADAALAYGLKVWKGALDAGSDAGDAARDLGRSASYKLDNAAEIVRDRSRKAGTIGARAMRDMRSRFTH